MSKVIIRRCDVCDGKFSEDDMYVYDYNLLCEKWLCEPCSDKEELKIEIGMHDRNRKFSPPCWRNK